MFYLVPDKQDWSRFMETDLTKPIGILNMLKFRDQARYNAEADEPARSGAEAYTLYRAASLKIMAPLGVRILLDNGHHLIGPQEEWDAVFVVYYPLRQIMLDMGGNADYRAILHHRKAGVLDSRAVALELDAPL